MMKKLKLNDNVLPSLSPCPLRSPMNRVNMSPGRRQLLSLKPVMLIADEGVTDQDIPQNIITKVVDDKKDLNNFLNFQCFNGEKSAFPVVECAGNLPNANVNRKKKLTDSDYYKMFPLKDLRIVLQRLDIPSLESQQCGKSAMSVMKQNKGNKISKSKKIIPKKRQLCDLEGKSELVSNFYSKEVMDTSDINSKSCMIPLPPPPSLKSESSDEDDIAFFSPVLSRSSLSDHRKVSNEQLSMDLDLHAECQSSDNLTTPKQRSKAKFFMVDRCSIA